jgi:hypothetical protein
MEYFVIAVVGFIVLVSLYVVYKFFKMLYNSNHYTYVTTYDEEGMEIETVVDWSDQTNYKMKKDNN